MRIRVFKQPTVLEQMLLLRLAGLSYKQIAVLFNCDYTTVYHHCKKYEIKQTQRIVITPFILSIISRRPEEELIQHFKRLQSKKTIPIEQDNSKWYIRDNGERVNKGFDYKEYLKNH